MKKIVCLFTGLYCIFCFINTNAQTPDWIWAKKAGGQYYDEANSIVIDNYGNLLISGHFFLSSIAFGSTVLPNAGAADFFLTKYDNAGNLLWAKSAGGSQQDNSVSVAVNDSGNSFIAGHFYSTTLHIGSTILTGTGNANILIAKYDINGNPIWAKSAGGYMTDDRALSVAADNSGNSYLTGYFGNPTITLGSFTLVNSGSEDIFIAKYDPNGNVIWAKKAGSINQEEANVIKTDNNGNVYVLGGFFGASMTIDSVVLTNNNAGFSDIFLAKYNSNGNLIWAKSFGGSYLEEPKSISIDSYGNLYMMGNFYSASIIFGSDTLTQQGFFIAKLDNNGNAIWARNVGNIGNYGLCDTYGNTYVAGQFNNPTIIFGNDTIHNSDQSGNYPDIYVLKYDSAGILIWAKSGGGINIDMPLALTADNNDNVYLIGNYKIGTTFGTTSLTNAGDFDIFIAKLSNVITNTAVDKSLEYFNIYPNPSANTLNISSLTSLSKAEVYDINGKLLLTKQLNTNQIDISSLSKGLYFIKLSTEEGSVVRKFVKE